MRRRTPFATYAGILVTALGFVVIALAWNGAAGLDYVQGQFPFLLSGGLVGLALIVIGAGVMVIQALREDAAARSAEIAELNRRVAELAALFAPADEYDPAVIGEYRPRPRVPTNGNGTTSAAKADWQQPT